MTAPRFPLRAAAALFLERQWLDRPRGRRLTAATLAAFAERTGGIQLDSINVIERAHHLTLWNRFGPYRRESLRRLIEKQRVLFEYWAHAACLVPASDLPAWRRMMLDYRLRHKGWDSFLKKHKRTIAQVEAAVRERGPLGNADFKDPAGSKRGGWWDWKPATHALDWLFMSGRIAVHSRVHFHKRFDLIERVLKDAPEALTMEAFGRWHVRRSLAAMGAATDTDLTRYLSYPRPMVLNRRPILRDMVRADEVAEVALEGDRGRWFVLREDLAALETAARKRAPSAGSGMLAPFDSFLWHRERTSRLFGFDYRIEVYTPGPKRTHGYYTLPLLVDGQLIGRADAKTHREQGVLELRRVHFEPWFAAGDDAPTARWRPLDRERGLAGVAEAAASLATFVGAGSVKLSKTVPARLHVPLKRAIASAAVPAPAEPAEAVDDANEPAESEALV